MSGLLLSVQQILTVVVAIIIIIIIIIFFFSIPQKDFLKKQVLQRKYIVPAGLIPACL